VILSAEQIALTDSSFGKSSFPCISEEPDYVRKTCCELREQQSFIYLRGAGTWGASLQVDSSGSKGDDDTYRGGGFITIDSGREYGHGEGIYSLYA
jgi:hypothetical protein